MLNLKKINFVEPEHHLEAGDAYWKRFLFRIINRSDTRLGKLYDVFLLCLIFLSTAIIMMESMPKLYKSYHAYFIICEWVISILFSVEYIVRIAVLKNKKQYVFSFFGIIDFLAIVPFYLSIFFPVTRYFLIFRMLRMLRVFRIFNLLDFMNDGYVIVRALRNSSRKIYIFLLFLVIFSVIVGSMMFMVEGGRPGFETIPHSIYWAVVTVTTVGYGDVSPVTSMGKFFAVLLMLAGYSIIAVPTGIVTAEMRNKRQNLELICERCGNEDIDDDARYCKQCGKKLA